MQASFEVKQHVKENKIIASNVEAILTSLKTMCINAKNNLNMCKTSSGDTPFKNTGGNGRDKVSIV